MACPNFDLSRCPQCPGNTNVVPPDMGEYYEEGGLVFIGEAPGVDEDEKGRPFIGKTGKEFNEHYLILAGTYRDAVYVTNAVKCRPFNNQTPKPELIRSCSEWHLKSEFRRIKPRIVILMGAVACSLVEGLDLEIHHGVPLMREIFGHRCVVIGIYHPAAGLHDTKMMIPLREDFQYLRRVINYGARWIQDEYPKPDYKLLNDKHETKSYLGACDWDLPLAIDTEYHRHKLTRRKMPYSLGFSGIPGTGRMILGDNKELTAEFARYVRLWKGQFVFHNQEADLDTLADMGIDVPQDRTDDTIIRAYNLGSFVRIGLKILAYRLCGMEMEEFEDVVRPYAHQDAIETPFVL